MTTEFDSFDGSALGEYVESPLGERNLGGGKVLLWMLAGVFQDNLKTLYQSMGITVHTQVEWPGNSAGYGLIIDTFSALGQLPAHLQGLELMEEPRRVCVMVSRMGVGLAGMGMDDLMEVLYPGYPLYYTGFRGTSDPLSIGLAGNTRIKARRVNGGSNVIFRDAIEPQASLMSHQFSAGVHWYFGNLVDIQQAPSLRPFFERLWTEPS